MRREPAFERDPHALGPLERHHLGGEDVRELGRAATEGERAEAADGAGVAVGHRVGRARQHHAELRRDHVRDALLGIVDVEKLDAVAAAALAHRLEKGRARRVGGVVAAGLGGDGVVLHREGEVRPAHRPMLLLQLLEGVRRVQLVQHVAVDIDELAAVGAARDQMGIPDLVEQGFGHDVAAFGSGECGRIAYSGRRRRYLKVSWAP